MLILAVPMIVTDNSQGLQGYTFTGFADFRSQFDNADTADRQAIIDAYISRVINLDTNRHEIMEILKTDSIVKEIINYFGEPSFISY